MISTPKKNGRSGVDVCRLRERPRLIEWEWPTRCSLRGYFRQSLHSSLPLSQMQQGQNHIGRESQRLFSHPEGQCLACSIQTTRVKALLRRCTVVNKSW